MCFLIKDFIIILNGFANNFRSNENGWWLYGFIPFYGTRDFVGGHSLVIRPNPGNFRFCF